MATACSATSAKTVAQTGLLDIAFFSQALGRQTLFSLHLPPGEPPVGGWPLTVILHGDGRNHRTLAEDPVAHACITRQPMAVLCPNGDRAWWVDSPCIPQSQYQSMLLELLDHVAKQYPVTASPAKTAILGWSMGGFGALRFAQDHGNRVCAVGTVMALADFPHLGLADASNYPVPPVMADPACHDRFNCTNNAALLRGIAILQVAPTDAFDYQMNVTFHTALQEAGIDHTSQEIPGGHDWQTVLAALPTLLLFAHNQITHGA